MKQSVCTEEKEFISITIDIVIENTEELLGWIKIMGGGCAKYSRNIYSSLINIAEKRGII